MRAHTLSELNHFITLLRQKIQTLSGTVAVEVPTIPTLEATTPEQAFAEFRRLHVVYQGLRVVQQRQVEKHECPADVVDILKTYGFGTTNVRGAGTSQC